jgi:hypothetical protein
MFAYNPAVTDRSAEILANANNTAAQIQYAGMQNFGQSIGNAMQSLGDGYSRGQEKARENAIKYDTAAGMIDAYRQFGPQFGIDPAQVDALSERHAKNPDALIASLAVLGRVADNNMMMARQQAATDGYLDLHRQKQAINALYAPAATPAAAPATLNLNYD